MHGLRQGHSCKNCPDVRYEGAEVSLPKSDMHFPFWPLGVFDMMNMGLDKTAAYRMGKDLHQPYVR